MCIFYLPEYQIVTRVLQHQYSETDLWKLVDFVLVMKYQLKPELELGCFHVNPPNFRVFSILIFPLKNTQALKDFISRQQGRETF